MLVIPSIDLKSGCVVRLTEGRYFEKIYSKDPLSIAEKWRKEGAKLLHIVDLDGALSGELKNLDILREILKKINIKVQFGGGIRNIREIKELLNLGVKRVIIGTRAAEDEDFLRKAVRRFGKKIIVSVDERKGRVAVKGWKEALNYNCIEFIKRLEDLGLDIVIYTDTSRDGTLRGPNVKKVKGILENIDIPLIISGGISSLEDIRSLKELEDKGLEGVIIGKALYEEKFSLREAMDIAKGFKKNRIKFYERSKCKKLKGNYRKDKNP